MLVRAIGVAISVTTLLAGLAVATDAGSSRDRQAIAAAGALGKPPDTPVPGVPGPGGTGTAPTPGQPSARTPVSAAAATAVPGPSGRRAATAAGTVPVPSSGPATTTAAPPSPPPPATPGTYRYRQTSSPAVAAGEGSLVVAPPGPDGMQVWTRKLGGSVAPSTTVMLFNSAGIFMLSPTAQVGGSAGSCSFPTPVPWPPWPLAIGRTFGGQATCAGPIHSLTIAGQIDRIETLPLGGATVGTFRVISTLVMSGSYNGSPISVTQTDTNWYAPSLPVPVRTQTYLQGTVAGLHVTIDSTETLESATPL